MQYRKVYCVKKNLESTLCPENEKPPKSQACNTHLCTAFIKGTKTFIIGQLHIKKLNYTIE